MSRPRFVLAVAACFSFLLASASAQVPIAGPYIGCAYGIGDVDKDGVPDYYRYVGRGSGYAISGKSGKTLYSISCGCPQVFQGKVLNVVATGGDINGDGYPDVMSSYPYAKLNYFGPEVGAIWFYSGKDGTELRTQWGTNKGDEFGYAVAFIGDVNKDGCDDYAVSIRRQGVGATGTPETNVYSGRGGVVIGFLLYPLVQAPVSDLRRLGDVNADGYEDLLAMSGRKFYVVFGRSRGGMGSNAVTSNGSTSSVSAGLDVNKDGVPDYALGYPLENGGGYPGNKDGAVYVYSLKDGTLIHKLKPVASTTRYRGEHFGESLSLVEDLNGDGHADILVGSAKFYDSKTMNLIWAIRGISGRDGEVMFTIYESNYSKRLTGGLSVIGDINGDKIPEVAIGRRDGWYIYDLKLGGAYGQGCASTTKLPTLRTDLPPRIAGSFSLEATNLLATTSGLLVAGASDSTWNTTPLPLDLKFMGMDGCKLLCSWDLLVSFSTTTGTFQWKFTMPKDPTLLGSPVFNQVWALDQKANPTGIATSNGVKNYVKQ